MSITERMVALLESLDDNSVGENALMQAINKLTFKYKTAWQKMTNAEAEEIGTLFRKMPSSDQANWRKGYTVERDALKKLIDAGEEYKLAGHHPSLPSNADILKDFDRMLKAFGV